MNKFYYILKKMSDFINSFLMFILWILAALLSFVEAIIIGRYVLNMDGRPLIRKTRCGKHYAVKEPGMIVEILGLIVGGTTIRDACGIPVTDDQGNYIKKPGFIRLSLT